MWRSSLELVLVKYFKCSRFCQPPICHPDEGSAVWPKRRSKPIAWRLVLWFAKMSITRSRPPRPTHESLESFLWGVCAVSNAILWPVCMRRLASQQKDLVQACIHAVCLLPSVIWRRCLVVLTPLRSLQLGRTHYFSPGTAEDQAGWPFLNE